MRVYKSDVVGKCLLIFSLIGFYRALRVPFTPPMAQTTKLSSKARVNLFSIKPIPNCNHVILETNKAGNLQLCCGRTLMANDFSIINACCTCLVCLCSMRFTDCCLKFH